jgi:transcription termination/antitermination protein NusG
LLSELQTERGEALHLANQQSSPDLCGSDTSNAAWYAVWLRSHYEYTVAEQLSAKGFHTFLPQIPAWSKAFGQRRAVRMPMFPGYLFVREALDKDRYIDMLKVRGVVRVLEDGWSRLTPVPTEEIDAIQQIVQADVHVSPHAHLQQGDRVRVLEGPLTGVEGIFVQDKPLRGRLVVSLNMLGRSVAVDLESTAVEACSAGGTRTGLHAAYHRHRHSC